MKSVPRHFAIIALCCTALSFYVRAVDSPADLIQPNSIWSGGGGDSTLTILERNGDQFRGRYTHKKNGGISEFTGTIRGDKIWWLAKDIHAIKGGPVFAKSGTIKGDELNLTYSEGPNRGSSMTMKLVSAPLTGSQTAPVMPAVVQTNSNQPRIETLKDQAPNAVEWALAPLDQMVPGDIRQNLTFLREDLLDEGKQGPKAGPEAYKLGEQLCNTLLAILEERNQSLAHAGFNAAMAQAPVGVTSQALEARRNYMMSWPQYAREQAQRKELRNTAINNAIVLAERPKLEWVQRTDQIRPALDTLYKQYRAALRQGEPAKQ